VRTGAGIKKKLLKQLDTGLGGYQGSDHKLLFRFKGSEGVRLCPTKLSLTCEALAKQVAKLGEIG